MYVPPHKLKALRPEPYPPPPKQQQRLENIPPASLVSKPTTLPPPVQPVAPLLVTSSQPPVPELKVFKPWYRYQLLEAKIIAAQIARERCQTVSNDLRVQTKRLLFKIHGYQQMQNIRVQEMFEVREDAFDILEAIEYQKMRVQEVGVEEANRDLDCAKGHEDHIFMRTGLRRIDNNIGDLEEKIERMDRLLAREALMCAQIEDTMFDFVQHGKLTMEEKEDWESQEEPMERTSKFLELHTKDLSKAFEEAKLLAQEDFVEEVESRKLAGDKDYTLMERLEKDFFKHITTFTDEEDDLMLLKELFEDLKEGTKKMVE